MASVDERVKSIVVDRLGVDEEKVVTESLLAIKRAGADMIISYFALDVARA